jgi:hypothetical protein
VNCHFIVEYAMDIVLKTTRDTKIGERLIQASYSYDSSALGNLFLVGYTTPIPPVTMGYSMNAAQPTWAGLIFTYGTALNQPTPQQTITCVDVFLEYVAENLLVRRSAPHLGCSRPIPSPMR